MRTTMQSNLTTILKFHQPKNTSFLFRYWQGRATRVTSQDHVTNLRCGFNGLIIECCRNKSIVTVSKQNLNRMWRSRFFLRVLGGMSLPPYLVYTTYPFEPFFVNFSSFTRIISGWYVNYFLALLMAWLRFVLNFGKALRFMIMPKKCYYCPCFPLLVFNFYWKLPLHLIFMVLILSCLMVCWSITQGIRYCEFSNTTTEKFCRLICR